MEALWSAIKDVLNSKSLAALLAVVPLIVLECPDRMAEALRLGALRGEYGHWLGIASLVGLVSLLIHSVKWGRARWDASSRLKAVLARLHSLSIREWQFLAFCVASRQQSINIPPTDESAKSLCQKGLLALAPGAGNGLIWAHTIPDDVWEHLLRSSDAFLGMSIEEVRGAEWYRKLAAGQKGWREYSEAHLF